LGEHGWESIRKARCSETGRDRGRDEGMMAEKREERRRDKETRSWKFVERRRRPTRLFN